MNLIESFDGISFSENFRSVIMLLLVWHILLDFHLQTEKTVREKESGKWLGQLKHALVALALAVPIVLLEPGLAWLMVTLVISHVLLDILKSVLWRNWTQRTSDEQKLAQRRALLFGIDQVLHLIVIFIFTLTWSQSGELQFLAEFESSYISFLLFLLLLTKPANVSFKLLFGRFADESSPTLVQPMRGAGAIIGTLERLIMALFLFLRQYAALALIFTAKSIARYDRISKSQKFAEYYLIGSLFSILWLLITYLLLFVFI